jgi:hypothetical protein
MRQDNALTYEDFITPEHKGLIQRTDHESGAIPVFFTKEDLMALFKAEATGERAKAPSNGASDISVQDLPIDPVFKEAFLDPSKEVSQARVEKSVSALTQAFSIFGYASNLGRRIKVMATGVDEDGKMRTERGSFEGEVNPELFKDYANDPSSGAAAFFWEVSEQMKSPERMVVVGFISSPNSGVS